MKTVLARSVDSTKLFSKLKVRAINSKLDRENSTPNLAGPSARG